MCDCSLYQHWSKLAFPLVLRIWELSGIKHLGRIIFLNSFIFTWKENLGGKKQDVLEKHESRVRYRSHCYTRCNVVWRCLTSLLRCFQTSAVWSCWRVRASTWTGTSTVPRRPSSCCPPPCRGTSCSPSPSGWADAQQPQHALHFIFPGVCLWLCKSWWCSTRTAGPRL